MIVVNIRPVISLHAGLIVFVNQNCNELTRSLSKVYRCGELMMLLVYELLMGANVINAKYASFDAVTTCGRANREGETGSSCYNFRILMHIMQR